MCENSLMHYDYCTIPLNRPNSNTALHIDIMTDEQINVLIRETMAEADIAIAEGNSPFAAIITDPNGEIVARSHNTQKTDLDPTAHGEINALRAAGKKIGKINLKGYKIFVNAEPCPMCMSAVVKAFIDEVYYGASQEQTNNPDIRATEVVAKCSYDMTLKGGFLADETAAQIVSGRQNMGIANQKFRD